ncbi:hypothetical protein PH213_20525 [Streptomyces sp. SRF1]|uniref:hypothetical protein n=1 Tax=Streptomyces sp. SRF1 TaxID=1549642 RepID=UPI0025B1B4AA|nr:hypothetical protein [Streptomyces sp. SRF1]MDN3056893.1 hypothetical protein [Streptomyces sp. SRF1]
MAERREPSAEAVKLLQQAKTDLETGRRQQGAATAQNAAARMHGAQAAGALYAARHRGEDSATAGQSERGGHA